MEVPEVVGLVEVGILHGRGDLSRHFSVLNELIDPSVGVPY